MSNAVLSRKELNRATLARQLLLRRAPLSAWNALEWLGGLRAQTVRAPYISLWSRLEHFEREDLENSIEERRVVRAPLLHNVLHLTTAADFRMWRPAVQASIEAAEVSQREEIAGRIDVAKLIRDLRLHLAEEPCTRKELEGLVREHVPNEDPDAVTETIMSYMPLVQVPPAGIWNVDDEPAYALAHDWLGPTQVPTGESLRHLVIRYLGAYGPARQEDLEIWAGMAGLQTVLDELLPGLQTFHDEAGRVLYDLPNGPRPDGDTEAPPRFLPHGDAVLHAHADGRLFADPVTKDALESSAEERAYLLLDGFVEGTWYIDRQDRDAVLHIEPLQPPTPALWAALVEEGDRLLRFVEEDAERFSVEVW